MKKLLSLLMLLALVLSLAVPAAAAETSLVNYAGHKLFKFGPGSVYSTTDLFDEFKDIMPGDTLTEQVTIKNSAKCCDYIKVRLRAVPHDAIQNPLSPEVGKLTTLAASDAFLSQLELTVKKGDKTIFSGKANALDGLEKAVYLGKLNRGKSMVLDLELKVPATMDNTYAYALGEVDWEFTVEEYDNKSDTPKTGDHMLTEAMPYFLAMSAGAAALLFLLLVKRRNRENT